MRYDRPSLARVALMGLMNHLSCPPGSIPKGERCLKVDGTATAG